MERFTISLSESLAKDFDELIHKKGYQNRSEAVRDMLRELLNSDKLERQEAPFCVAALSYVYNHHARDLAERLTICSTSITTSSCRRCTFIWTTRIALKP